MKRLLMPIIIIAGSLYFGACNDLKIGDDFLEKGPGADVTLDTIFSSKQFAERALVAAYKHLPYGVMYSWDAAEDKLGVDLLESTTDLCQSGGVVPNAIIITDNTMHHFPILMM